MARKFVFADECGNFDFSAQKGASRYFILVSVTLGNCTSGDRLLELRRNLAAKGKRLDLDEFHATTDEQAIRDQVFPIIAATPLRVDAVILEKRKAYPRIRATDDLFYKHAWYQHMKYVAPRIANPGDDLLVVGASIGTAKKRKLFHGAVASVLKQISPSAQVACWTSTSEPCLQIADYCAWAIQRKWERNDVRSYDLIKHQIKSEFDIFEVGGKYFY